MITENEYLKAKEIIAKYEKEPLFFGITLWMQM